MRNYDGNTKSHHKQMAWHQHKKTILKAYREVSHNIWWLIKKKAGEGRSEAWKTGPMRLFSLKYGQKRRKETQRPVRFHWVCKKLHSASFICKRRHQEYLNKPCSYCPKLVQIVTYPFRWVMGSSGWDRESQSQSWAQ